MFRASLEIVMRNGAAIVVRFPDDEVVNMVMERLKKCMNDEKPGIFSVDVAMSDGTVVVHYLPSREIVRFSLTQNPRVAVTA